MSKVTQTTEVSKTTVFYSDIFTDFTRHAVTGELNKKTNESSIKQSVKNLLLTNKYERLFEPELGSNLKALLFENATPLELPYHGAGKHIVVGEYFFRHRVAVRLLGLRLFQVLLRGFGSLLFHCLA